MLLENAIATCRASNLTGWELVGFAQHLVNQNMKYSTTNSFDTPEKAFEKGQGYCWHQASLLNMILIELGLNSRLVHAFRNLFPKVEFEGTVVRNFVTGHVWCRVIIDGIEKDVCPGDADNSPGIIHFKPISKVREWDKQIEFLTYYGAALFNFFRSKRYGKAKKK